MVGELHETDRKLPKGLLALQSHCPKSMTMEARATKTGPLNEATRIEREKEREREYRRSIISDGNGKKKGLRASYFSLESMLLLVCLTVSLLILPLILPPLPPPPFLLLLLPIAIFALLMILAFMPSNVRDLTYTYM